MLRAPRGMSPDERPNRAVSSGDRLNLMINSVLVIDDDPIFAEILKLFFEQRGATLVQLFQDAAKAVDFLKTSAAPDLITMDLNMPDFDRAAVFRELNKMSYTGSISIVSADTSENIGTAEAVVKLHGLNLANAVKKPLTIERFDDWASSLCA